MSKKQVDPKVTRNVSLLILTLINKMHRLSIRVGGGAKTVLASLQRTLKSIVKSFANPLLNSKGKLTLCRKKYIKAKSLSREETQRAVSGNIKCMTSHAFKTALQYCVPVLSAGFLIASVRYTASLEYGITSTYTQEELEDIDQTQPDTLQSAEVVVFPKFAFKTIEDSVETFESILDNVREEEQSTKDSHEGMSEGYGVFVEDEFLGAVLDKSSVEDTLNSMLGEYLNMENVTEAHFTKNITYTQGWYTTQYMVDPQTILETLTGNAKESIYYTVEEGDNLTLIAEYANISLSELLALNPQITNPDLCLVGDNILVQGAEPFLSVEYTETITTKTEIPFETTTQNDDTIPVGETKVLTQGVSGEQTSTVETTYIDGVAVSTVDHGTEITRPPTTEVLAIGTGEIYEDVAMASITMETFNNPVVGGIVTDTFNHQQHNGLDISAPRGTPVLSSASGTVVSSGWNSGGYGYFAMVDHGNGYSTLYAHMSQVTAVTGQLVTTGETLGYVGSTGNSNGNYLHFEVRHYNVNQNPQEYLNAS